MKHAAALLARRAHSRGELRRKLAAAAPEASDGEIGAALDRLEHLDLLNDADYAYNFSLRRLDESGWGPAKIRAELLRREVAGHDIDAALDRALGSTDATGAAGGARDKGGAGGEAGALEARIDSYCARKGTPSTGRDAQRLARHLLGRGFGQDAVAEAVRRRFPAAIQYPEGPEGE